MVLSNYFYLAIIIHLYTVIWFHVTNNNPRGVLVVLWLK